MDCHGTMQRESERDFREKTAVWEPESEMAFGESPTAVSFQVSFKSVGFLF